MLCTWGMLVDHHQSKFKIYWLQCWFKWQGRCCITTIFLKFTLSFNVLWPQYVILGARQVYICYLLKNLVCRSYWKYNVCKNKDNGWTSMFLNSTSEAYSQLSKVKWQQFLQLLRRNYEHGSIPMDTPNDANYHSTIHLTLEMHYTINHERAVFKRKAIATYPAKLRAIICPGSSFPLQIAIGDPHLTLVRFC